MRHMHTIYKMESVQRFFFALIFFVSVLLPTHSAFAACSSYAGQASLNEFYKDRTNQAADNDDFVEVKILNSAITSTIFNSWTIQICEDNDPGNNNDNDGCSSSITLSNFTETNPPWLVYKSSNIGRYINFKTGFDAILKDASGNVIDYLSVDGYTPLYDSSCSSLPFDTTAGAPGASDKFIFRTPDGTGNWDSTPSGSATPTEDDTNDEDPSGNPAPTVSVSDVVVNAGQTATFTLSISSSKTYNITVQYTTQNNTAIAGTDYTAVTGTATIAAGSTSTTIDVSTSSSSTGGVSFYLYLYSPVNGTLSNHYPLGTILENPLAAWFMDGSGWSGTSGEVTDSTGNGYNGTAVNGATTTTSSPAIAGSPGTCGYGVFDGTNDYIALPGFPNLTGSFTITAWIRADRIDKDQRIFVDDENNSGGYALSLGDGGDGRLRFFNRGVSPTSLDTSAVITTNTWYHVAMVHNASAKTRQIFVNGVAATVAQTYTGSWGTDSGTASIGGETNGAGSEAVSNWRFDGNIDEVRVFNSALNSSAVTTIMNTTRTCPGAGIHHFEITHDGTGLTCEPETISVRACADSSCSSLYTTDASVTFSPTGWVGGDTQTISSGSGTLQLSKTTAGTYTLGVSSSSPAASSAVQCVNTGAANTSCDITYYDTGFIYDVPNLTSCQTSANVTVSAVRLDNTTQACVPSFQNVTQTVNFWSSYSSPATGTKQVVLNNGTSNYTLATASPGTGVPLGFDNSGQATITVTYSDAGQLALNSSYTSGSLSMTGSDSFVTVPAKLYVYSDDANAACASNNASCTAFVPAGTNFNLKVRGACADNSVTPNYIESNIALTHTNTAPAIAQGTLGSSSFDMADADDGEHVISQTVSEVGVFTFTATPTANNYFGLTVPAGSSTYIGRFVPDHFCVTSSSLSNRTDSNTLASCSDAFSYLDEDLTLQFTVAAQRTGAVCGDGTLTQNYHATFSKFDNVFTADNTSNATETGVLNFGAIDNTTATNLNSRIEINTATSTANSGDFASGTATFTAQLDINRLGTAPGYTAEAALTDARFGINPIDTDSRGLSTTNLAIGTDNYFQIGNTSLYFGRLYGDNAFGSEQSPLPMWARTQYCSAASSGVCTAWLNTSADTCSLFTVIPPAGTNLGNTTAGDGQGYWNTGSDYSRTGGLLFTPDAANHTAGWNLWYTAGGTGGTYTIPFVAHPYLITQDGAASFGLYRGDDRIIYWREVFN